MKQEASFINHLQSSVIAILFFLFPIFFLPITQEYFVTNKLYLLIIASFILTILTMLKILITRTFIWQRSPFFLTLIGFLIAIGISTFIIPPNPTQSLYNLSFSFLAMVTLTIVYFHALNTDIFKSVIRPLLASSLIVATLAIVFILFQPFKTSNLPTSLEFLKNSSLTPIGTILDLAIFLVFIVGLSASILRKLGKRITDFEKKFTYIVLIINLTSLIGILYFIIMNHFIDTLPPFGLSWHAAGEVIKHPLSAAFGVGIDNFSTLFTRVRDISYNTSPQWQIESFNISRSSFLHIFTETGVLGSVFFLVLIVLGFKQFRSTSDRSVLILPFLLIILIAAAFPPSLVLFFLFFVSLLILTLTYNEHHDKVIVDISSWLPFIIGGFMLLLAGMIFTLFSFGKAYLGEYYMKKSQDGLINNNLMMLYNNQKNAIAANPKMESYHLNFSQSNLLLAHNLSSIISKEASASANQQKQLVSQAVQAALAEAKSAASLNPNKALYWENLGNIYRSMMPVAKDADTWTISSYQRALNLDPKNPEYILNLGGVYYEMGQYTNAQNSFSQAIAMKPDWPNAHYNLAWSAYQTKDYQLAISEMQKVITLINPSKNAANYQKAQDDLIQFKKQADTTTIVPH